MLGALGVRFSVGTVCVPDHPEHARRLRAELPDQVRLWVNAAEGHTYTDEEAGRWTALDPLFPFSRHPHRSAGPPCRARPRACPLEVCDCHTGYVRLETLPLYDVFAGGLLERVPRTLPDRPPLPLVPSRLASLTADVTGSPE